MAGYSITRSDMSREILEDHGDGTGTITHYAANGSVIDTAEVNGLEVVAATVDPLHQLAQAIVNATSLDDVKPAAQAILDDGLPAV